ncbi:MAG: FprA family A-type flavoprotein [Bacillales bacterium]|nr:FprA family A-type flavoprotein [Bacillales bacterium]
MYCTRNVTEDLVFVGSDDRRLSMFEGTYGVPRGISYNSYLLLDEKTVLFDTVDKAIAKVFFENVKHVLNGRKLDYLFVHHVEPDHAATLEELILRYPEVKVVCNRLSFNMIKQFFDFDLDERAIIVDEDSLISSGKHNFIFRMAPMVHWPEVMVTYDKEAKILFSADAFGLFGAQNGNLFADEVDFERDYLDESRRYYANVIGKYGVQVNNFIQKISAFDIQIICPLHGFVWRKDLDKFINKYKLWASYTPEVKGVLIAYASIYGNTENAVQILASKLSEAGIKVDIYDTSVTAASFIIAEAFKYSHIIFASATYNTGIFVAMENLLHDIEAHNLENRTVAFIENGSWAPRSYKLMREIIEPLKGTKIIENKITIKSSLKENQLKEIEDLKDAIVKSM